MTDSTVLRQASISYVQTGGTPVTALFGPLAGGVVTNPLRAADQGVGIAEPLYISVSGPAAATVTETTFLLYPGQNYVIPWGLSGNVSVNAATSGHKFSAIGIYTAPPEPTPVPSTFPPIAPTALANVIPSYLYQQYTDDDNLQSFVNSYNGFTQYYITWFNNINLPIYTGSQINGALLDWVAQGLYGIRRGYLFTPGGKLIGPYNTWELDTIAFDGNYTTKPTNAALPTDDIFKRIITWHFFKGDGKVFTIRWLKRRIMRFLLGTNGTNYPVSQTNQISVELAGNNVSIRLLSGIRTLGGQSTFNSWELNSVPFNNVETVFEPLTPLPNAAIFKEAVEDGTLELPFQFNYTVTI